MSQKDRATAPTPYSLVAPQPLQLAKKVQLTLLESPLHVFQ